MEYLLEGAVDITGDGGGEVRIGMITDTKDDARGDKGMHSFWIRGMACIFGICMMDSDAAKYRRSLGVTVL